MNEIVTTVEQTKHVKNFLLKHGLLLLRASMKLEKHKNFRKKLYLNEIEIVEK